MTSKASELAAHKYSPLLLLRSAEEVYQIFLSRAHAELKTSRRLDHQTASHSGPLSLRSPQTLFTNTLPQPTWPHVRSS